MRTQQSDSVAEQPRAGAILRGPQRESCASEEPAASIPPYIGFFSSRLIEVRDLIKKRKMLHRTAGGCDQPDPCTTCAEYSGYIRCLEEIISDNLPDKPTPSIGDRLRSSAVGLKDVPLNLLTHREREVMLALGSGLSSREAAKKLFLSVKTIETHRQHICEKFGIKGSNALIRLAVLFAEANPK
jgi:DNA-binding CsgD family transcriptional regulator